VDSTAPHPVRRPARISSNRGRNVNAIVKVLPRRAQRASCPRQVSKHEAVALDDLPEGAGDWVSEDRPCMDEGVKLAVLTAGIDLGREIGEQTLVVTPPRERRVEFARVDADDDGPKASLDEASSELRRVSTPERKKTALSSRGQTSFAIGAHVLEEEIAKRRNQITTCSRAFL
jgi:hypothetical protein